MTEQEQIEEMANCDPCYERYGECPIKDKATCTSWTRAVNQYEQGYRKIPEDAVVLTKEEYEVLANQYKNLEIKYSNLSDNYKLCKDANETLKRNVVTTRKETAREILNMGKKLYKMSYHKSNAMPRLIEWIKVEYGVEIEE